MVTITLSRKEEMLGIKFSDKLMALGFTQFHGEWDIQSCYYTDGKIGKFYPTKRDLIHKKFTLED